MTSQPAAGARTDNDVSGIAVLPPGPGLPAYTVRRLRPEDAPGVSACVRTIYGQGYMHPEVYHPEQLVRLNEVGELVSVVARDGDEAVVGHYALERPGLGIIAEEGEAMVLPEHRHHHLMEAMRDLLEAQAHRLRLTGLYGQAVTNHLFTQRVHDRYGLRPCGLSLGVNSRSFQNMPEKLPQRMSLLLGFKYLRAPAPAVVHVPARHRAICARIYEQLGVPVGFSEPRPADGAGEVAVDHDPKMQEAVIRVRRVGADTAAQVAQLRRDLCDNLGAEAVFLEMPAAQPGTPALGEAAEAEGFFFSGIGPCFAADGDALRLQFLNVALDLAYVQVENPFARDLLAYVGQERQRVGNRRG